MIPFVFVGPYMIEIFAGKSYLPAEGVFRLVAWDHIVMVLFTPLMVTLFAINRPILLTSLVALEMIFNIAGDLIFVPTYGASGAAAVTLVTRIIIGVSGSILLIILFNKKRDFIKKVF